MTPITQKGYNLLHHGSVELARIEANGIRIDIPCLQKTQASMEKKLRQIKSELSETEQWQVWRRRFGDKANLTSHKQLGAVLHVELDYEIEDTTETGLPSTNYEALEKIKDPFVRKLSNYYLLQKAHNTWIKGILKELVDDRIHPVVRLDTVRTYRSSSECPNFQNVPVRNKVISRLIRRNVIASPDSVLVENDFKGIEVGVSGCYHQDENFIRYITDKTTDMHRDMAAQIYMLEPGQVSEETRYGAKNKFVFPQFYGDFYVACARNLWDWISKGNLKIKNTDISLYDHLKENGIQSLGACDPEEKPRKGTFEYHLKEVEDDFWNNRFQAYGQWRKDWYKRYLDKGYFDLFTGFRIHGSYKKNAVTNYPIQGSAFHCLLWCLIRINRILQKRKMCSKVVFQIHDSLLGDVRIDELQEYLSIVEQVTTVELRAHWDWIKVPLEIEYEIAPVGQSWFDKKKVKFKDGQFQHPKADAVNDMWTRDAALFLKAL